MDQDDKDKYTVSITIWIIALILLSAVVVGVFFMHRKNRTLIANEAKDLQTMESRVAKRREDLKEREKLLSNNAAAARTHEQGPTPLPPTAEIHGYSNGEDEL